MDQQETFIKNMQQEANACVAHFSERYGSGLDFSVKSLELLDSILDEAADFFEDLQKGQQDWIVEKTGAYIFEVARTNFGGRYFWYDQLRQPILVTGMPDFEISILAFEKVKGRLANGREDNIPFYFKGYAERVRNAGKGDKALIV